MTNSAILEINRPKSLTRIISEFRELLRELGGRLNSTTRRDFESRPIAVTPFSGNYGRPAGWVICVEGSPHQGTLLIINHSCNDFFNAEIYYMNGGRSRRMKSGEQTRVIRDFCKARIGTTHTAFTIEGK